MLAGRPPAAVVPSWRGDDGWSVEPGRSVEELLAAYQEACAVSRQLATGRELADAVPHPRLGQVPLRWTYLHMIEETARHAGYADILREQADGATGFDAHLVDGAGRLVGRQ